MKNIYYIFLFFILFFLSCATVKKSPSPWQLSGDKYSKSVYIPEYIYDFEEAMANLQDLQFDLLINGLHPSEITVDKFFFKAKLKWSEMTNQNVLSQKTYFQSEHEKTIILPFKDVYDIILNNNFLHLNLITDKTLTFYLSNSSLAQKMADSIYSILHIHNVKLRPIVEFSFNETQDEKKLSYLNKKEKVVYVTNVLSNSPAKLAGLCENDIILEINGEKITDVNQCSNVFMKSLNDYLKDNSKIIKIKVFHFEESNDKLINWEERLIKIKPAIR